MINSVIFNNKRNIIISSSIFKWKNIPESPYTLQGIILIIEYHYFEIIVE